MIPHKEKPPYHEVINHARWVAAQPPPYEGELKELEWLEVQGKLDYEPFISRLNMLRSYWYAPQEEHEKR